MKEYKSEVTRQEFEDLKCDVKDLHKIFDKITEIAVSTEKLAIEMKYMREEQNKTELRLKALEEKPIKRYDSIVNYIITTIIGLALGAIAVMIGLKK